LHGWRGSNSRPLVLETNALPIELHPYIKYLIITESGTCFNPGSDWDITGY
jgi:hypothetical protein